MSCVASRSGVDCIDPMKGLSAGSSSSELSLGAEESSLSLATMDGCLNNARRASPSMVKWGLAGYVSGSPEGTHSPPSRCGELHLRGWTNSAAPRAATPPRRFCDAPRARRHTTATVSAGSWCWVRREGARGAVLRCGGGVRRWLSEEPLAHTSSQLHSRCCCALVEDKTT
jgi:hypothetical protein